jgi:hypothetical protein
MFGLSMTLYDLEFKKHALKRNHEATLEKPA